MRDNKKIVNEARELASRLKIFIKEDKNEDMEVLIYALQMMLAAFHECLDENVYTWESISLHDDKKIKVSTEITFLNSKNIN